MEALWRDLKKTYGLPVMTTAYMFREVAEHRMEFGSSEAMATDIHCPPLAVYDALMADRYRAEGKEVWWYTCCSPHYPYPNVAPYAYPAVECRLMGWLTKLVRADGFLYWHVNYWRGDDKLDERETYFPSWRTDTFPKAHGDGVFMYPGCSHVLSGIRLAQRRRGGDTGACAFDYGLLARPGAARARQEPHRRHDRRRSRRGRCGIL